MIQEVKGKKLEGVSGILLVLGVVVFFVLLAKLLGAAQAVLGYSIASVLLWLAGCVVALWILRTFVMGFRYVLSGEEFTVTRIYGKRGRPMLHVLLRCAVACGTPEEMQKRFPNAKTERAIRKDCSFAVLAVAFKTDTVRIICLQPNDELRRALVLAVKER